MSGTKCSSKWLHTLRSNAPLTATKRKWTTKKISINSMQSRLTLNSTLLNCTCKTTRKLLWLRATRLKTWSIWSLWSGSPRANSRCNQARNSWLCSSGRKTDPGAGSSPSSQKAAAVAIPAAWVACRCWAGLWGKALQTPKPRAPKRNLFQIL